VQFGLEQSHDRLGHCVVGTWGRLSDLVTPKSANLLHGFAYKLYRPDSKGKLSPAGRYPATGLDVFARQS
jgi:hypothetical protein